MRFFTAPLLAVLFMTMFMTSPVFAKADQIAIVDMQMIMRESDAAKSVQKQIAGIREEYKNLVTKEENKLRDLEKDLVAKKASLSAEEFQAERKKFEQEFIEVQKDVREKQITLDKAINEAMDKIRVRSVEIIASMAKEHNASLVLPRQNIIIVDQELDLTKEVLAELNQVLSDVKVKVQ